MSVVPWFSVALTLLASLVRFAQPSDHCRNGTSQVIKNHTNADYIVGGLFPLHYFSNSSYMFNEAGLTWVEAMLFAIDEINRSTDLLPNVTLGYSIYDSCNNPAIALRAALDMTAEVPSIPSATTADMCTCNTSKPFVVGIVGDAASASSTRVAALSGACETPQISYSTTTPTLSDKSQYPTFFRTIAPDNFQADCIVDLLLRFNWTYVNVIAQDDNYGRSGAEQLMSKFDDMDMCTDIYQVYNILDKEQTKQLVTKLHESTAAVTVLWCQISEAVPFFQEAARQSLFYRTWIATEAYGSHNQILRLHEKVVQGLFGIIPHMFSYRPFETHLVMTTRESGFDQPWRQKYWNDKPAVSNSSCGPNYNDLSGLPRSKYIHVINAVYALAHSLHDFLEARGFNRTTIVMSEYVQRVRDVNFTGVNGIPVNFDSNGNPGVAVYSITNLEYTKEACDERPRLRFNINAGLWTANNSFVVNKSLWYANMSRELLLSSCRPECQRGEYAASLPLNLCCWTCKQCQPGTTKNVTGTAPCRECMEGMFPNKERDNCVPPVLVYFKMTSTSGLTLSVLLLLATVCTISVVVIIHVRRHTPLVKSLNCSLSYLQLASMTLTLTLPFIMLTGRPTTGHCGGLLYGFVVFNVINVSVVFMKADRLLRIFRASKSHKLTKKSKLRSNRMQFAMVAVLAACGILLCTVATVTFPPRAEFQLEYGANQTVTVEYFCGKYFGSIVLVILVYMFFIAALCGVYAFKARKLPENYNEAAYTSFAMFIFSLTWTMFIVLFFSSTSHVAKMEVFLYSLFASTTSMLGLMYGPKLYVIVLWPERNTKEFISAQLKNQSMKSSGAHKSMDSVHAASTRTATPKGGSLAASVNSLVRDIRNATT